MTFWFGRDSDVRYLARPPEVGDYITHGNELWLVSSVDEDWPGIAVICEPSRKVRAPYREGHGIGRDA